MILRILFVSRVILRPDLSGNPFLLLRLQKMFNGLLYYDRNNKKVLSADSQVGNGRLI